MTLGNNELNLLEPQEESESDENSQSVATKHIEKWKGKVDGVETNKPNFLAGDRYKNFIRVSFTPAKVTPDKESKTTKKYKTIDTFETNAIVDTDIASENESDIKIKIDSNIENASFLNLIVKKTGKAIKEVKIEGTFSGEEDGGVKIKINESAAKRLDIKEAENPEIPVVVEILEEVEVETEQESVDTTDSDVVVSQEEDSGVEEDAAEGRSALAVPANQEPDASNNRDPSDGAPQSTSNTDDPLTEIIHKASASANVTAQQSLAERFAKNDPNLKVKIADNGTRLSKPGQVWIEQSLKEAAATEAALKGNIVVMSGKELMELSPGKEKSSGVILDWQNNKSVFIGSPKAGKRTRYYDHIINIGGSASINGFNSDAKESVGATVVVPAGKVGNVELKDHPVPGYSDLKLGDPIFPGCAYTWEKALSGSKGLMEPDNDDVLQNIMKIAQVLQHYMNEMGNGPWTVTSWYRNAAHNAYVGGASQSQHLSGNAVDFWFEGFMSLYDQLEPTWEHGLAYMAGSFIHLDLRQGRSRWQY